MEPAIGVLELNSIVQGIHTADQMCKVADVQLIDAFPVCPGKYMILVTGDVGAVKKAVNTGDTEAKDFYVDSLIIPNIHSDIIPAILGATKVDTKSINAVGALECFSIASCIVAADTAAKEASVKLIELRLAKGLGGKSFFTLTGEIADVKAAIVAARQTVAEKGNFLNSIIIPSPNPQIWEKLF